jgi:SecD/SecF fusion protein
MPQQLQNPAVLWLALSVALGGAAYAFLRQELRVRATAYGSFLIACFVAFWPPWGVGDAPGKIHLGLDLRGGIHLVMQVVTDDALNATVADAVQTTRDQVTRKGITFASAQRQSPTSFSIDGIEPARVKDVSDILKDFFRQGWQIHDRGEGGFTVGMTDVLVRDVKTRTVQEEIRTLERRVNELGVAEPIITEYGSSGDQILIQLPGVTDVEAAKNVISRVAQLSLSLVEDVAPSQEALLQAHQGKIPDTMDVVQGQGDEPGRPNFYLVRKEPVITGRDLKNARAGVDQNNAPDVQFTLNPAGAEKFKRETGKNVGRRLAIILDGRVESAPTINSQIGAEGVIQGRFSVQEADELSKVLRAGALPATLKYLQQLTVGATLGKDSIRAGVTAAIAGMAFLAVFMVLYYRLAGVNAIVALTANLVILLGALAYAGATLTLPGIAGIILTIGVGVDTNVLVFERIREELRNGKTVKAAVKNGFERVWITILDTHATALIAAAFLFQFGTGPIKGFAVTLVMGLVANVFASYFVSWFLFEWTLGSRPADSLSIGSGITALQKPSLDFLGRTTLWVTISVLMVVVGWAYIAKNGLRYGVEFEGGTQLIVRFQKTPEVDKIRAAVDSVTHDAVIQSYDEPAKNEALIRIAGAGETDLSVHAQSALKALAARYADNPVVESSTEVVGPVVGAELRGKAINLTLFGLLFQLLYIGWRFRGAVWGTAATIAVFHDVLVTIGLLAMMGHEISLNVIAALLTLVGYSVNDTIVVFDRVRENLKQRRKDPLPKIINDSVNQTLSRTLISSGTTFLTVLGLFLFGGEVLRSFSFTMVVGIVVGTYSTIYIASPLVVLWERLRQKGGGQAPPAAKAAAL